MVQYNGEYMCELYLWWLTGLYCGILPAFFFTTHPTHTPPPTTTTTLSSHLRGHIAERWTLRMCVQGRGEAHFCLFPSALVLLFHLSLYPFSFHSFAFALIRVKLQSKLQ
mmetsp:Transcript_27070/g.69667  ORF Transcript_27070/g.69667 Transcript_27070/m.69667 type:complete len:110 (+) Transcript_27070:864-1193(+)